MDPDVNKTYSGAESGPGAKYAWSGNRKVGQGSMEITDADAPSRVQIALEFLKPFKASNTTAFTLTPMLRLMGLFKSVDAMMGPDFERGLAKLKAVAEASTD